MTGSTVTSNITNTPNAKISELQMMLSTEANCGKRVMLVEGPDDKKFYSHFVSDSYIILNVLEGCYYMSEILASAESTSVLKDKVIGIKDADFDHITGKNYHVDNFFVTDTHDWETMVLTQECEVNVAIETLSRKEPGLFEQVMKDLINYSYIKLYNEVEVLGKGLAGICFKGFNISKVYDGENSCRVDVSLCEVKEHGGNKAHAHFPSESDIDLLKNKFHTPDLRQLTCGHDVIYGVVCRLTKIIGRSPQAGYTDIERLLRASCTLEYFKTTRLFQAVSDWAKIHNTIVWEA